MFSFYGQTDYKAWFTFWFYHNIFLWKIKGFTHETHTYLEHLLEGQEFADIEEDFWMAIDEMDELEKE